MLVLVQWFFFCKNSRETEPKNWKTEKLEIPYVVTMTLWRHCALNKNMKNWAKKSKNSKLRKSWKWGTLKSAKKVTAYAYSILMKNQSLSRYPSKWSKLTCWTNYFWNPIPAGGECRLRRALPTAAGPALDRRGVLEARLGLRGDGRRGVGRRTGSTLAGEWAKGQRLPSFHRSTRV